MPKPCKISLEEYENDKPKVLMGTTAGLTKEFNISVKLRLKDPLSLNVNGVSLTKRIGTWINQDPIKIWELIYGKTPKGSAHLSLTSDAITALKTQVEKICPEALTELEAKKKARLSRRFKRLTK